MDRSVCRDYKDKDYVRALKSLIKLLFTVFNRFFMKKVISTLKTSFMQPYIFAPSKLWESMNMVL